MRAGDDAFEQLRRAIDALADAEAADLVAEARIEARAKVRSILAEAMAQALLERAQTELSPEELRTAPASRRRPAGAGAPDHAMTPARPASDADHAVTPARPASEPSGEHRRPRRPPVGEPPGGDPAARSSEAGERRSGDPSPSDAFASPSEAGERHTTGDQMSDPPSSVPTPSAADRPDREESASPANGPGSTRELGWYVYCVVDGEDVALDDLPGVDGAHPVTMLRADGLGAVASLVPLDEFGEDTLRESLNDVTWLEDKALAHERVLDHVRKLTTVIPMRLCTIYHTDVSVLEMLMREATALTDALERLAGRTEWGVKVFGATAAIGQAVEQHSGALADLTAEVARASPGEAYMLRKRLEELRAEEVDRVVEERCDAIHARLSAAAVDALLNAVQPREVTDHDGEMLLNGVYLVDDTASESFHGVLAGLRDEYRESGFELALTGPWPPYNFVKGTIEAAW